MRSSLKINHWQMVTEDMYQILVKEFGDNKEDGIAELV